MDHSNTELYHQLEQERQSNFISNAIQFTLYLLFVTAGGILGGIVWFILTQ